MILYHVGGTGASKTERMAVEWHGPTQTVQRLGVQTLPDAAFLFYSYFFYSIKKAYCTPKNDIEICDDIKSDIKESSHNATNFIIFSCLYFLASFLHYFFHLTSATMMALSHPASVRSSNLSKPLSSTFRLFLHALLLNYISNLYITAHISALPPSAHHLLHPAGIIQNKKNKKLKHITSNLSLCSTLAYR